MPTQKNDLNFEGQNIYTGFDMHLKSWQVTILTDGLSLKIASALRGGTLTPIYTPSERTLNDRSLNPFPQRLGP